MFFLTLDVQKTRNLKQEISENECFNQKFLTMEKFFMYPEFKNEIRDKEIIFVGYVILYRYSIFDTNQREIFTYVFL